MTGESERSNDAKDNSAADDGVASDADRQAACGPYQTVTRHPSLALAPRSRMPLIESNLDPRAAIHREIVAAGEPWMGR